MSVRLQAGAAEADAGVPHGSVPVDVPQLHHCVSPHEPQDLPAGEHSADGDGQSLRAPVPSTPGSAGPGWEPHSRPEDPHREAGGRESGWSDAQIKDC